MKKFYMILAALLIGSVCFAQNLNVPFHKMDNPVNGAERSAWVGSQAVEGAATTSLEYAIAPKQFDANISGNITKVKFYHEINEEDEVTNTSYTIKIYDNINLTALYPGYPYYQESSCGTAAYTQVVTPTQEGWQEVTLNTPFAVPTGEFWVAVEPNNGTCVLPLGGSASAVDGQSFMKYSFSQSMTAWITPTFNNTLYTIALAIYVDDGGAEQVISDFEAKIFGGFNEEHYLISAPTEYSIGTSDNLVIYPFFTNNGPSVATSGTLTSTIKLGDATYGTPLTREFTAENPAQVGQGWDSFYGTTQGAVTITAAEMNAMGVGNNFNICYQISYTGNDNVEVNNSFCIPVTRTNAVCDIQAKLYTDAEGTIEAGSTINLGLEDDLSLFPAYFNAGPDAAEGTVTVTLKIDDETAGTQSVSLSSNPLPANEQRIEENTALNFSAAVMDYYQLTGTFEVCYVITYGGNDSNTENNTVCVTITRGEVAVEENIAEEVSVYPNPANDMFTVANAEGATIVVVNSLGQVVSSIENAASNQTIDASNFANGTYFVKVNENVIKINVVK
ncbi:MAG: T9SS type A sorting domain-containing protein [Bacteroidales bacterium]|nr:T9SS type A sorting domain-containing protein [Bacteroidales bacterium]